jgi:aryl-alcohol dehydrogenase-like predicted oxidoreductase
LSFQKLAALTIQAALDAGINLLDSGDSYRFGHKTINKITGNLSP